MPETETPQQPEPQETPTETPPAEADPPGAEALGDPGKKALDAMKQARNEAREQLAEMKRQLEDMQAQQQGREAELQAERDRQKAQDDAIAKANERILRANILAEAARKFADPKDALLYVKDITKFEVGEDGETDASAIRTELDQILKDKPYLAAQGARFEGGADSGVRNDPIPQQLNREDLSRLSPDQIVKAQAEGRLNRLLGIK